MTAAKTLTSVASVVCVCVCVAVLCWQAPLKARTAVI